MADFDDFRDMFDDDEDDDELDDFSDISFDDIVDDDLNMGQEIGSTDQFSPASQSKSGPVNQLLASMTSQQRLIISAMLFGNVLILSVGILLATGRLG